MSLGVLNNISAIYAENNLQFDASESADDPATAFVGFAHQLRRRRCRRPFAGQRACWPTPPHSLSLRRTRSEGVGFLQVADGALSQVTSLLNRAVTLATEASNGTLNTNQDTAADSGVSVDRRRNQQYRKLDDLQRAAGFRQRGPDRHLYGRRNGGRRLH